MKSSFKLVLWFCLICIACDKKPVETDGQGAIAGKIHVRVNQILGGDVSSPDSTFLLDNVRVDLKDGSGVAATAITEAGRYRFNDVPYGTYDVIASVSDDITQSAHTIALDRDSSALDDLVFYMSPDSLKSNAARCECDTAAGGSLSVCLCRTYISSVKIVKDPLGGTDSLFLETVAQGYENVLIRIYETGGMVIWEKTFESLNCLLWTPLGIELTEGEVYFVSVEDSVGFIGYTAVLR